MKKGFFSLLFGFLALLFSVFFIDTSQKPSNEIVWEQIMEGKDIACIAYAQKTNEEEFSVKPSIGIRIPTFIDVLHQERMATIAYIYHQSNNI